MYQAFLDLVHSVLSERVSVSRWHKIGPAGPDLSTARKQRDDIAWMLAFNSHLGRQEVQQRALDETRVMVANLARVKSRASFGPGEGK